MLNKPLPYREYSDFIVAAQNKSVVIYDTGKAEDVINALACQVNISHIVNDDFANWKNDGPGGYAVRSPHTLKNSDFVVLITQPYYAFAVEKKLIGYGVEDYFCYGFFSENLTKSFKVGYDSKFVQGKAFPQPGDDTCFLSPRLTNRCNCECPFCCVKYGKQKDVSDMDIEKYKTLLDDCKGLWIHGRLIDTIEMDGSRELFVYPDYRQAIIETHKRGFKIQVVTNGVLLTHENSKLLMENGLSNIIISVTGVSTSVYAEHQGYNRYAEEQLRLVIENVRALVELRQILCSNATIGISYLIDANSAGEVKDAIMFWKEIGVDYFWGNALSQQQEDDGVLVKKRQHSNSGIPSNICFNPGIAPNGDLNPCFSGEGNVEDIVIGNVFETPLSEIIYTDEFNMFYANLVSHNKNLMNPICVRCPASGECL